MKWTDEQLAAAIRMKEKRFHMREIGEALGRSEHAVRRKLEHHFNGRPSRGGVDLAQTVKAPEEVVADRNRRMALNPRDLTAAIFGDPLPGHSALERRS